MGKEVRSRAQLLACNECGVEADAPCVHKVTGKPLKGLHGSRVYGARQQVTNEEVARIEGDAEDKEFWAFVNRLFGIEDLYHGEW